MQIVLAAAVMPHHIRICYDRLDHSVIEYNSLLERETGLDFVQNSNSFGKFFANFVNMTCKTELNIDI